MTNTEFVVISVPGFEARGGINGYFYTIEKYYKHNSIKFVIRGARKWPVRASKIIEFSRLIFDVVTFTTSILNPRIKVVHLNTSLGKSGVQRDIVFQIIAKILNKKVIVFFHGWNPLLETKIDNGKFRLFNKYLRKIDVIFTLSIQSKKKLIDWGFKKNIYLMNTIVDDEELYGWTKEHVEKKFDITKNDKIKFLFLARVEKEKGIYEAIETYKILSRKYSNICFNIAGDGLELEKVKKYIKTLGDSKIKLHGYVKGENKIKLFRENHIFLFPSYTEGMPTGVLEAMANGLVIVTRPVGGLVDFFNSNMGLSIDSLDPKIFANNISNLLNGDLKTKALYNFEYAKNHFYASLAAKQSFVIYEEMKNS